MILTNTTPTPQDTPPTVEDYLNTVNYNSENELYVPTAFAIGFMAFIKMVNDGKLENKSPLIHYKVVDKFDNGSQRVINLMHRGLAKTTLIRYLFWYCAVIGGLPNFGDVNLILYISDSIENGVKNMRKNLEFEYNQSAFLQRMIPKAKFTDIHWEFENLNGKVTIIKGFGAKTGVRGVTARGQRPDMAVFDDIISDEDARSATVISAIEDTVYKAVMHALHPTRRKLIWNGTPFNANDPIYKAVESGTWEVNVYPVCEQFPVTKEEFRGSWEDRFTYEFVAHEYEMARKEGNISAFNQELMLRIMNDDERLIPPSCIQYYDPSLRDVLIGTCNIYVTTDFATSESQHADFSGCNVWAHSADGGWWWLDGFCKRQTMDKNIEALFRYVETYAPLETGIEVSGQQGGFIPWIKKEMVTRNLYFNIASSNNNGKEGIRPTTNKMQRFNVTVPWFKAGQMHFPDPNLVSNFALHEMLHEIGLVSVSGFKSRKDDQLDNISQLPLLNSFRPSRGLNNNNNGSGQLPVRSNSSYFV